MTIPKWLIPTKEQIAAAKVVLKSMVKGAIMAFNGWLTLKLGGSVEMAGAIAIITAPLIKAIDPNDHSIGKNRKA